MTASAESHADDPIPALVRRCWAALETLHVVAYFAPEPAAAYRALGLSGRAGYFASRSAPMGPVPAGVTVATFYVFAPASDSVGLGDHDAGGRTDRSPHRGHRSAAPSAW